MSWRWMLEVKLAARWERAYVQMGNSSEIISNSNLFLRKSGTILSKKQMIGLLKHHLHQRRTSIFLDLDIYRISGRRSGKCSEYHIRLPNHHITLRPQLPLHRQQLSLHEVKRKDKSLKPYKLYFLSLSIHKRLLYWRHGSFLPALAGRDDDHTVCLIPSNLTHTDHSDPQRK